MNIMHQLTNANDSESKIQSIDEMKSPDNIDYKTGQEKIRSAINEEVDKIFGKSLERTNSSCDLQVRAPLRNKRREYRSHEVLPIEENVIAGQNNNTLNIVPSQSEAQINDLHDTNKLKVPRVTILHDNQRAEIVASVTERLYSKLKKKEEVAVSKMDNMVDKKIVEPLSELKICTNARQRLIELSQKAIRNRRKIGIPAYTQTRETIMRVKDKGIDVQSDLENYCLKNNVFLCKRDASTETLAMTPRYKEIGVGSKFGLLNYCNKSTITDKTCSYNNSCVMTESTVRNDNFTQTKIMPPPRRKKRKTRKGLNVFDNYHIDSEKNSSNAVIRINISQTHNLDSESQSSEDNVIQVTNDTNTDITTMPSDLLANESIGTTEIQLPKDSRISVLTPICLGLKEFSKDFSDSDDEDKSLPRVMPNPSIKSCKPDMKDLILGRNKNIYPYNLVISPSKEKDFSKRLVTFRDLHPGNEIITKSYRSDEENFNEVNIACSTSEDAIYQKNIPNDPNSCKRESSINFNQSFNATKRSFICKNGVTDNDNHVKRNYVPVYRSKPRYKIDKARLYKDSEVKINDISPTNTFYTDEQSHSETISSDNSDKLVESDFIVRRYKPIKQHLVKGKYLKKSLTNGYKRVENRHSACSELESSVNNYNNYIKTCRNTLNRDKNDLVINLTSTPTEYLQHLIKLRREVVQMERVYNEAPSGDQQN